MLLRETFPCGVLAVKRMASRMPTGRLAGSPLRGPACILMAAASPRDDVAAGEAHVAVAAGEAAARRSSVGAVLSVDVTDSDMVDRTILNVGVISIIPRSPRAAGARAATAVFAIDIRPSVASLSGGGGGVADKQLGDNGSGGNDSRLCLASARVQARVNLAGLEAAAQPQATSRACWAGVAGAPGAGDGNSRSARRTRARPRTIGAGDQGNNAKQAEEGVEEAADTAAQVLRARGWPQPRPRAVPLTR